MKTVPQILARPLLLALLTAGGLIAALVSDAAGDVLGWVCLAYVAGVGVWHAWPRQRRPSHR